MTDDVQGIRGTLRESALRCAGLALVLHWRDTLPLSAAPTLHWRRTLSLSAAVRCTTKDLQNNLNRV
jgi:hypothetical protein